MHSLPHLIQQLVPPFTICVCFSLCSSTWLSSNWINIVNLVGSKSRTCDLSTFLYLSDQLPEVAVIGLVSRSSLTMMWATLTKLFSDFVVKVTGL